MENNEKHFDGKHFFNPGHLGIVKGLSDLLKWQLSGEKQRWPQWVDDNLTPQIGIPVGANEIRITYINHATLLIETARGNLITDPVFSKRASPVAFAGPKRVRSPGLTIDQLPKIDAVLVSHNHYDHMDLESLAQIEKLHQPLYVTPLENARHIQKAFPASGDAKSRIKELDWWESHDFVGGKIYLTQVLHWSRRTAVDTNESLWGGFAIETPAGKVYFSGDTGYADHFVKTQERLGDFDIALLPLGAYAPRWFMKNFHMDPQASVKAHIELKSKLSIGMHFGTFQLTDEAIDDPIKELAQALKEAQLSPDCFIAPKNGQSILYKK